MGDGRYAGRGGVKGRGVRSLLVAGVLTTLLAACSGAPTPPTAGSPAGSGSSGTARPLDGPGLETAPIGSEPEAPPDPAFIEPAAGMPPSSTPLGSPVSCPADPAAPSWPFAPAPLPAIVGTWPNPRGQVTMVDGRVQRDGAPWTPKMVNLVAVAAPWGWLQACPASTAPEERAAATSWTENATGVVAATVSFGADSVRLVVSQAGMVDPTVGADYARQVAAAVQAFRAQGLPVVVGVQWDDQALGTSPSMPTADTGRVLDVLAGIAGADRGVLLELFDEPMVVGATLGPDLPADAWDLWKQGGRTGDVEIVGHQRLLDGLRDRGFRGLVLADGLARASTFAGVEGHLLDDPAGSVVYAVHPYFHPWALDAAAWQVNFGNLATSRVVWADEWYASSSAGSVACAGTDLARAEGLLDYLDRTGIALGAYALDEPDTLLTAMPGRGEAADTTLPASITPCSPDPPVYGVGELVNRYFLGA